MKNNKIKALLVIGCAFSLIACNNGSLTSNDVSSDISSEETTTSSEEIISNEETISSEEIFSSEEQVSSNEEVSEIVSENIIQTITIKEFRESTNTGEEATIKGVVVKHNYTGQQVPYKTGFWIADETGSVYIYGENSSKKVEEGNLVTVKGIKGYYIPQNDLGAASSLNYDGMMQLSSPEILENDNGNNEIPKSAIIESSVEEISKIPLNTNITGNIYRVQGRYSVSPATGFTNYYINDLNRVDSLLAYTQSNGMDYEWTTSYDDKTVDMLIIVSLAKPGTNSWRFCPVKFINDEYVVSDELEAKYASKRVLSNFADTYDVDTLVSIAKEDEYLPGSRVEITSTSDQISVNENGENLEVNISASTLGKITISAKVTYNDAEYTSSKEIEIIKKSEYETISIAEARTKNDDEEVTLEAVVACVTYKSNMVKQGLFLADETGSMFAYFGTSLLESIENIENGHKIVIKGKIAHYIKNSDNAKNEGYAGDFQLSDGVILNHDTNVYDIPEGSYVETTIKEIAATKPSTNLSGNMYKVKAKVVKNTGYATSYSLYDVEDNSSSLPLYSQVSANDFKWLEEYASQEVTIIVGVQNLNLKASGSFWRGCPIKVISNS